MIEPTRLHVVRHGRTAWNADMRIQGHRDEPLDALGRWQAAQRERDPDFGPPGGERLTDFYDRSVATVRLLADRHPGRAVLVVAHGGVLHCLYRAATHVALDAPRSWQLGNASINRLLCTAQGLTLVGWNDDAHLASPPESAAALSA